MRILVVDDDPGSRLVAEATVRSLGHECYTACDGDEAWQLVEQQAPDVVVTDRAMPGMDGLDLCRRIRESARDHYTYVVLVTSLDSPDAVLEGMQAGADDYVPKPLNPFDLQTRLLAADRVTRLHADLASARAELTRQANTDPLTGLRNRLGLGADLEHQHGVSQRYDRGYCVALGDIDFFKGYNDTYGHLAGDEVLRRVAGALSDGAREVDRVYRYGGEEFLLLLPETSPAGAATVVQRLLEQVQQLKIEHRAGGASGVVTMSFGIATCAPHRRLTSSRLLVEADEALYRAKDDGRNRLVVAGASTPA